MRIDFWLPHLKVAGGTKISLTYAFLLAKRGHAVRVFAPQEGLLSFFSRKPTWRGIIPMQTVFVKNWQEASTIESDIVVADSWQTAGALAELKPNKKLFHFIQHDERLYHGDASSVEAVYRSPVLNKIVVSTWLKEIFEKDFKVSPAFLLNTVDRTVFCPQEKLRIRDQELRVLVLVHPYPWKGTAEGVALVDRLKKKHPNVMLVGFGVREKRSPYALDEYHYNPSQEDLRDLYASADIFLCPSWDEGFGLPSLEAMASGAALVTYDNGGSRDFAFKEKTALVAPRRDREVLFAHLERLVGDQDLRNQIASGGRAFVETLPTWDEQAGALERILMK